ncbi:YhdT family protein [Pseudodesulfovibrio indicus]|uniref:YhdT family protein n=1 Tax=Pseudodesulfovibrio indicus TaxID=1716143 RepID=UPI00292FE049|nr:YhdT family protein [Pseudodesulfovibrio indicus]
MERDERKRQSDREALLALAVYVLYFVWWYVFGYGVGGGAPEDYDYVFGFPAWFFYSCVAGYPLVTVLLWVFVRLFFRDIPLDAEGADDREGEDRP